MNLAPVNHPINQTGSRWEKFVDNVMEGIEKRVGNFEVYAKSVNGQYRIAQVQLISTLAAAVILAFRQSLIAVVASAAIGIVVRAFSAEQLDRVQQTISRIVATLPFGVKALATVIAVAYTPIVFPVIAGMAVGFEVGARISPQTIANGLDDAAGAIAGKQDGELLVHTQVEANDTKAATEDAALKRAPGDEVIPEAAKVDDKKAATGDAASETATGDAASETATAGDAVPGAATDDNKEVIGAAAPKQE